MPAADKGNALQKNHTGKNKEEKSHHVMLHRSTHDEDNTISTALPNA